MDSDKTGKQDLLITWMGSTSSQRRNKRSIYGNNKNKSKRVRA